MKSTVSPQPGPGQKRGNVWLVTHLCPPAAGGGVQRNTKLAKYLSLLGWNVRLVTTKPSEAYVTDNSLLSELTAHAAITRFGSLDPQRLLYLFRRVGRRSGQSGGVAEGGKAVRAYRLVRDYLFFPDAHLTWVLFGVFEARAFRGDPPSVVIGSHPVPSCLVLAALLGRRFRVPVILDLRDGWIDDRYTNYPTRLHRAAHRWLERRVYRKASLILANTPELAAAIVARHPDLKRRVAVVPNGFDDEEVKQLKQAVGAERIKSTKAAGEHWITYTGAIHEDRRLVFCNFLRALSQVRARGIDVRLRVVGGEPAWAPRQVAMLGLDDAVVFEPYLPRMEMLRVLGQSDACLVLQPTFDDVAIPGKVYEYLGMGLPILAAINPAGAAARLLHQVGQDGFVCSSDDVNLIAAALERLANAPSSSGASPDTLRPFTRKAQAELISEHIAAVIGQDDRRADRVPE